MKANEAPERLYFDVNNNNLIGIYDSAILGMFSAKNTETAIKYIRSDAFIEKAVKWIEEINNHHHIMRYSDSCEPPLSELTEWFKNYIKGE